jgi:hypothetical protein
MKHLIFVLSFCIITIFNNLSYAEVYKWVDENGVSHYGDEERLAQQKGATQVKIKPPQKIGSVQVQPKKYTPKPLNIRNEENANNINYAISLISPTPNEEIRANNGTITVISNISPRPQEDYSIKVFIDNSLFASSNNSTRINVEGVPRGEHTIQLKLAMKKCKIYTSKPVKFYVLRVAKGGV